jgi:hypothetical protein
MFRRVTCVSVVTFGALLAVASAQPELPPVQIPPNVQDLAPPLPADGGPIPGLQPNEVLTRGPVHEAFAQPAESRIEVAVTVKQQPPDPLPEVPPDVRPEDENAQWIPGYWAYDAEQNQFIWVSGMYRVAPPNRVFVPGHWANTPEGWTWIPGFWAPRAEQETPYLPEPPPPKEEEPQVAGPEDSFYVPGNWVYTESQYQWRPGYYARYRADRIWVPARYLWTPSGYLFVPGYWDYPLERRGLLFAPVVFQQAYWRNPGWRYQPRYVVNFSLLLDSLFARPAVGHFYFGDYYGANYARLGYRPWFERRYDPLFAYYRYENRTNPNWATGVRQTFVDRSAGRGFIPPRTLADQTKIINQTTVNNTTNNTTNNVNINKIRMIAPVEQSSTTNNVKVTKVDAGRAQLQEQRIRQFREMQTLRAQTEKPAASGKSADPKTRPQSLKIINTATAGGGNNSGGNNSGGNVGKEPKTVQPKAIDPKTFDPKSIDPKTVEPKKVTPKTVDPTPKVDPMPKIDPFPKQDPNPKKELPKQVDPTPQPKKQVDPQPKFEVPKKEFPKQIDPTPQPKKQVDPQPKFEVPKEFPKQIDPMPQPKKQVDPQPKFEVPKKELPKQIDPMPQPKKQVDPQPKFEVPKKEFPKQIDPMPQPKKQIDPQPKFEIPKKEFPKFVEPAPQPKVTPQPVPQPQPQPQPKAKFDPPPVRQIPKAQPMPQPTPPPPPPPQPKAQPAPVREAPKGSPKADPPAKKKDGGRQSALRSLPERQTFVQTPASAVSRQPAATHAGNAAAKGRRR